MNTPTHSSESPEPKDAPDALDAHYTPRHVKRKIAMVILGLCVFAYGWSQLWPPLSIFLAGNHALAEATQVIKTKPGLPDQVFTNDVGLSGATESHDRSYVFWNEFKFVTPDKKEREIRLDIGSHIKPLFPLLDEDGLPTTVQIYYDPKNPDRTCVPSLLSTWFAPGLITFMGAVCFLFGCLILYNARRKIEIN